MQVLQKSKMAPVNNTMLGCAWVYVVSFSGMPSTYRPWMGVRFASTTCCYIERGSRPTIDADKTPQTRFPAFMDSPSQECRRGIRKKAEHTARESEGNTQNRGG